MPNLFTEKSFDKPYHQEDWQRGYQSQTEEYDYEIKEIEGEIPPLLEGTLFRNGPGLLDINGSSVRHPFDGDGMVSSIVFKEGKAYFRNRFVRTEGFIQEQKAGKFLYRGVFGTKKAGGWLNNILDLKFKNIANTNVIYWGGKLLALWEAAQPYRLNPSTLETIGIDYLDGILKSGDAFSAHPRIDPNCQMDGGKPCLVNFGLQVGLSTTITLSEFNPDGKLLRHHRQKIQGFSFVHDFAITPNYAIFFQNAVDFNPLPFLLGLKGAGECLKFQPQQETRIIMIPRHPSYQKEVKILKTQAGFVFHHANAFESEEKVIIDSICYASLPQLEPEVSYREVNFEALAPGQLWRFTLDLSEKSVQKQMIESRCCEFPALNPEQVTQKYRYLFLGATHEATGNAPLQGILKLDLHTQERQLWSFAPRGYVGEPIFVPKPKTMSEDEGWVLTMVYDAYHHRSALVILDGQDLTRGAIATLHLKHHIPYGLHGSWTKQCFG